MVSILMLSGMISVHSKRAVFTALAGVPGILSADVEMGQAVIDHDSTVTSEALEAALAAVECAVIAIEPGPRSALPLFGGE